MDSKKKEEIVTVLRSKVESFLDCISKMEYSALIKVCEGIYKDGYDAGREVGFDLGYEQGCEEGYAEGCEEVLSK